MNWFIENWYIVLGVSAVVVVAGVVCVKFFKLPTQQQITKVKEWLVWACTEAEKKLGGETGQIKLRYVYDLFVTKFAWLAKIITFEQFSKLVDDALIQVKHLIETNQAIANYVEEK